MALDFFSYKLGISQGRMETPDGEDYVFILGDAERGDYGYFKQGDYAEIVQETDLTDLDFVRTEVVIDVPDEIPDTYYWEVAIVVDSIIHSSVLCDAGRVRRITDLAANVSKMTGVHEVGVRLIFSRDWEV